MITVIIPTQDRCDDLLACLEGLAKQRDRSLVEQIVIVDDNSRKPYRQAVLEYARYEKLPVQMYDSPGEGAAIARNHAASFATGRILALLDDDAIPDADWAGTIARAFENPEVKAITGRILPLDGDRLFSRSRQLRYEMRQKEALANPGRPVKFLAGGNSAVLRSAFLAVGGFDPAFTSMHDVELSVRLGAMNHPVHYVHGLLIHHRHYKGLGPVLSNSFNSAYFRQKLEAKHAHLPKWSLRMQFASYGRLMRAAREDRTHTVSAAIACSLETIHTVAQGWYRLTRAIPVSTADVSKQREA